MKTNMDIKDIVAEINAAQPQAENTPIWPVVRVLWKDKTASTLRPTSSQAQTNILAMLTMPTTRERLSLSWDAIILAFGRDVPAHCDRVISIVGALTSNGNLVYKIPNPVDFYYLTDLDFIMDTQELINQVLVIQSPDTNRELKDILTEQNII